MYSRARRSPSPVRFSSAAARTATIRIGPRPVAKPPPRDMPSPRPASVRRRLFALACSLVFALAATQSAATTASPSPFPIFIKEKEGNQATIEATIQAAKKLASFSVTAPFTTYLANHRNVAANLPLLHKLITAVDNAVTTNTLTASDDQDETAPTAERQKDPAKEPDDDSNRKLTTCNHRNDDWKGDIVPYHRARGLPVPNDGCISDVHTNSLSSQSGESTLEMTEEEAFDAVSIHAKKIRDASEDMVGSMRADPALRTQLTGWSNQTAAADFSYSVRDQRCSFDHAAFIREQAHWYALITLTNAPQDVVRREGQREYLHEFVRLGTEPKPAGPARPVLAKTMTAFDANQTDWVRNTSTIRQFDKGAVTASAFSREFPRENLAVQEALRRGEHHTQQASDATTLSNIAILAFPLVMNAVPVALIADVNTKGMLAYTLLTDVLTAVPLAIKGVEVLNIARQRNRAVIVRITGGNLPPPDVSFVTTPKGDQMPVHKAAEVWVAECFPTGSLRATGISLLAVALSFMAGGIVAEVWARDYVRRKKKAASAAAAASSGATTGAASIGGLGGIATTVPASIIAASLQRPAPLDDANHSQHPPGAYGGTRPDTTFVTSSGTAAAANAALTSRPQHGGDHLADTQHNNSAGNATPSAHVAISMAESMRESRRSRSGHGDVPEHDDDVDSDDPGRKVE